MPVTNYIWDELNDTVLMETDGSGNTTAVYTNEPGQFGGLISERQGSQSQYYHYDGLGSTRELTNSTGQVTDSYLYDAFGNTIQSTGTSVVPYHFVGRQGYYYDQELAEYYVRARQYCVPYYGGCQEIPSALRAASTFTDTWETRHFCEPMRPGPLTYTGRPIPCRPCPCRRLRLQRQRLQR